MGRESAGGGAGGGQHTTYTCAMLQNGKLGGKQKQQEDLSRDNYREYETTEAFSSSSSFGVDDPTGIFATTINR